MSEATIADNEQQLTEIVRSMQTRMAELEAENDQLRDRVAELEEEKEEEASLIWESDKMEDLKLVHPETGFEHPIGLTISSKLTENDIESEYDISLQQLVDDVEGLKRGEVDTTDLVGGADPELPIEEDLGKANDETRRSELSTNRLRAVHVFRNFISESKSWSGMMTLDSADVRRILKSEGETDLNDNDARRTMRMLAKQSANVQKKDRDPQHEENLFTLTKGDKRLELQADKDELVEFWQGMEARYDP